MSAPLKIDVRVTSRALVVAAAGLLMLAGSARLWTQSFTLSSVLPAPSAAYRRLITTSDSYLARDGGKVGVGNSAPRAALDVGGLVRLWNADSRLDPPTDPSAGCAGELYYNASSDTFRACGSAGWAKLGR